MLCDAVLSHPEKNLRLYGQALDSESFSACQTRLLLRGLSVDLGQRPASPLLEDMHSDCYFDYILANPPFNFPDWCESGDADWDTSWQYGCPPQKNANFAWLQHILNHLSPTGRAVVLLPNSTLTTRKHAEWAIRERILRDGWVEAILALPAGLLLGTRIPCCAWVINRDTSRDTVLFIDARQMNLSGQAERQKLAALLSRHRAGSPLGATQWYAAAPMAEVEKKEYILSPNLYTQPHALSQPSFRQLSDSFSASADALCARISAPGLCGSIQKWKTAVPPSDWVEFRLPELYTITGGVFAGKEAFGHGVPMADVKTVIHHMFLPEALPARVQLSEREAHKYGLRAGDILLNRTSETIDALACCCAVTEDRAAVYGAYLKRLRPYDNRLDTRYAAAYFRSRIYRQEVRRVSLVYTTRASINLPQLSDIRVYAPDMAWQTALGETLADLIHFSQSHGGKELHTAIERFVEAFIEKFITYPVLLFQKERDQT